MNSLPLLTLPLIALVSACTSTPYSRVLAPPINGVLFINSEPKPGINLYLSLDSKDISCNKHVKKTISDEQGQFYFASIKEQMSYTPVMTYYLNEWVICADIYGSKQMIYSDNYYGQERMTESFNLTCDSHGKLSKQITCRNDIARKD